MNAVAALITLVLGVTTLTQPVTIKSGTNIACVMQTAVDASTANAGDTFTLDVKDPSQPALEGARIRGHITHANGAFGTRRAEIGFLFDSIRFASGARVPIRAYVLSRNVVRRSDTGPGAPVPPPGPVRLPNTVGPPSQDTMVWQTTLGPKNQGGPQTGGVAYAPSPSHPLVVQAGTPVTIQLASDLQVP